ncbi:MAG: hypothetical protein JJ884_14855 [Maricaulis sp.]|uniref:hypothetical protein n=1 Tax=Maricaulis sp. TaxID=1486257 RepID=UPI001B08916F|nr:hypothetical protein [Maricaulis sp.]MBO6848783.1 hypothetical protein [Maricaulis sp.]MBO6878789.1 hypothetical protein [Maricaulis sp.]
MENSAVTDQALPPVSLARPTRRTILKAAAAVWAIFPLALILGYLHPETRQWLPELTVGWGACWSIALLLLGLVLVGGSWGFFWETKAVLKRGELSFRNGFRTKRLPVCEIRRIEIAVDDRSAMDGLWLLIVGETEHFELSGQGDPGVALIVEGLAELLSFDFEPSAKLAQHALESGEFIPQRFVVFECEQGVMEALVSEPQHTRRLHRHAGWAAGVMEWTWLLAFIVGVVAFAIALGVLGLPAIMPVSDLLLVPVLALGGALFAWPFQTSVLAENRVAVRVGAVAFSSLWAVTSAGLAWLFDAEFLGVVVGATFGGLLALVFCTLCRLTRKWAIRRGEQLRETWKVARDAGGISR